MRNNSFQDSRCKNKEIMWIILFSSVGMGIYLLASYLSGHLGFPLDDSWIHQTYARNLANYGEFSIVPGHPSAGSTSPLWTAVLSVGYILHFPFFAWTILMGWLSLNLVSWAGMDLARRLSDRKLAGSIWVGLFLEIGRAHV